METSLTVREADGMLSELAGGDTSRWRAGTEPCSTRCLVDAAPSSKAGRGRFEPRAGLKPAPTGQ